jgi:hypothetical protein
MGKRREEVSGEREGEGERSWEMKTKGTKTHLPALLRCAVSPTREVARLGDVAELKRNALVRRLRTRRREEREEKKGGVSTFAPRRGHPERKHLESSPSQSPPFSRGARYARPPLIRWRCSPKTRASSFDTTSRVAHLPLSLSTHHARISLTCTPPDLHPSSPSQHVELCLSSAESSLEAQRISRVWAVIDRSCDVTRPCRPSPTYASFLLHLPVKHRSSTYMSPRPSAPRNQEEE